MIVLKVFIVLFVTIVLVSCAARRSEPIVGRTFKPKNMQVQHGQELYMRHCQKCHPGGEGGLGPAINPNPAPGFVKKLQMRVGIGVMPAFSHNEIPSQDLKDISKYLKALKRY